VRSLFLTAAAGATALTLAGTLHAEQANPTRVGVQDPLDSGGLGVHNVLDGGSARVGRASAFNPAISVILDGIYRNTFSGEIHDPAGFEGGHDHGHGHGHGGGDMDNGFFLRETEIAFTASVDPYFDAIVILAVEGDHLDLEEAYFTTRGLPAGLQLKAGRFLSDIGYINRQHPHDWDFVDRPLVNEFLFGDHGLQDNGVQLSWIPPVPLYTRLGVEVLQGQSGIASYVGDERYEVNVATVDPDAGPGESTFGRSRARAETGLEDASGPRLFTAFLKVAPDLGFDHAIQFGVSGGYADTWQRVEEHSSPRLETWDGDVWFAGADVVYKYDSGRSYGVGNLTIQGEYFYREIDVDYLSREFQGAFDGDDTAFVVTNEGADQASGRFRQDGAYLQTVYGFAPRWNAGIRAEALGLGRNDSFDEREFRSFDTSYKYAAQVSFMPTEFSRLRLQANYLDFAHDDDHGHDAWTVMLQYNLSLGAHGAHDF